ncbi:hypothetical protein N9L78_01280 [Gammaproteobacteria bacterium]|jgi:hypothetical protein|nr:hypothetical protein [Gammaproteobacteria bacterium]
MANLIPTNLMKILLALMLLSPWLLAQDERLVSELSIEELKNIVRDIVEESIEKCSVSGTMNGRAKVNLKVEGEVVAKMECEFEESKTKEQIKTNTSTD